MTAAGGTLAGAFRIFLQRGRTLADRVIDPLVVRDAATVRPTDELARAAIVMIDRGIRRIPVVDDGALVGTLSTRLIDPGQLTAARPAVLEGVAARRVVQAAEARRRRGRGGHPGRPGHSWARRAATLSQLSIAAG